MDTIAKPTTGSKQSARPDQSTAAHGGPRPGRPGHIPRPACVGAFTRRLTPGLRDQTGWWSIGEYCHRNHLARESVIIRRLSLPLVIPESQVSRTEMPSLGIAGASTLCLANEAARKSPPRGSPLGGYAVRPSLTPS